jgi:hypothetical protein
MAHLDHVREGIGIVQLHMNRDPEQP